MPKHYAMGTNVQAGTVVFNNTKTMTITFPTAFKLRPHVNLTLADDNNAPAHKQVVSKTQMKIKFKTPFTGEVDWQALEM